MTDFNFTPQQVYKLLIKKEGSRFAPYPKAIIAASLSDAVAKVEKGGYYVEGVFQPLVKTDRISTGSGSDE